MTGFTTTSFWYFSTPLPLVIDQGSRAAERLSMLIMSGTLPQGALATFRPVISRVSGLPQPIFNVPMVTRRSIDLLA